MSKQKTSPYWVKILKNPFLWGGVIGVCSLHIVREMADMRRGAPPPLVHVGEWSLIDHHGQPFGSNELAGKVVIADLFFTSCPTICPELTKSMSEVAKRFSSLESQVHFVSISIDPEIDTPQILRKYMKKNGANLPNWSFVTGNREKLYSIVLDQMKLHAGEKKEHPQHSNGHKIYDIEHVAQLLLFDQNGDLRGLFPTQPHGLAALERAAKLLLEKGALG